MQGHHQSIPDSNRPLLSPGQSATHHPRPMTPTLDKRTAPTPRPPTWLHSPQRVYLRRALFQIHLWTGILITAYAIVIGLTGSALVFAPELTQHFHPALYNLHPTPRTSTIDAAVRHIEAIRPGWTAFGLEDLNQPTEATTLLLRRTHGAPTPNYRVVAFNPYTGQILSDAPRYAGLLGFLTNLHVYLLTGEPGLIISGWMAIGLLILALTGIILWWPGVPRWASALLLHRRTSWRRINFDLHTVLGFWSSIGLLLIILTGIELCFPTPFGNLLQLATGHGYHQPAEPPAAKPALTSPQAPTLTIDEALTAARRILPPDAPPGYLALPTKPTSPYFVIGYYQQAAPYSQLVRMLLDPHTGAPLSTTNTRDQDLAARAQQYSVALHFGLFGGPGLVGLFIKILWVLLGILPALLGVTGLLMYWNRKLRPLMLRTLPRSRE
ncbi:MAG: PepSY-associated TM helix domain-containing protein [Acidobacteriaceae bacterium]